MERSRHLQIVRSADGHALCYHALLGNLYLLNPSFMSALDRFNNGGGCNLADGTTIITDLRSANFLEDSDQEARDILADRNKKWMQLVPQGGRLSLLTLIISEACNFGCGHCLHKCSIASNKSHGTAKLMDWATAKLAIDAYVAILHGWGRHQLDINFGSAEPLLNWSVIAKAIPYVRDLDKNAPLTLNTNLSLLNIEQARFLRDYKVYISTSLDGLPEGNDKIRKYPDGTGTSGDIINAIHMLSDIGYPLDGISVTINDLNFDQVTPEFVTWAKQEGFRGIATDIDLINTANASRLVPECVDKMIEIWEACLEQGLENFGSWTTAYHSLVNGTNDDMSTFCKAVKGQSIAVSPEGRLFICGHTTTELGEITQLDKALSEGSPYVSLVSQRLPGSDPSCFGCSIEGMCAGQCHITREVAKSTGNGRDKFLCDFFRLITSKLLSNKLERELAVSTLH